MSNIIRVSLAVVMMLVGAVCADATTPLRETLDHKNISADFASINTWKPELPLIHPISNGDADEAPEYIADMLSFAGQYKGLRYRRGGKTPKGFDCSGFTSFVFRNFGFPIDPGSRTQALQGKRVSLSQVEVGDLMFFSGRRGGKTVGHVGMVVEVNDETGVIKFIHSASSKGITIQSFPDGGYYSNRFLHAQRVIEPEVVASR